MKSSLVEHFTNNTTTNHYVQEQKPTTSALVVDTSWLNMEPSTTTLTSATAVNGDSLMNESINKQLLDLESLLVPMNKRVLAHGEEEEEDEDDIIENEIDDEEFLPE